VQAWTDEEQTTWIEAQLAPLPDWTLAELDSPGDVERLVGPLQPAHDHVVYWAWLAPGVLRVRCFAPRLGIAEDEATGSAALRLATLLAQPLEIRQGNGSLLRARPVDSELGQVGGFVVEDAPLPLP
jgi:hypothetical protein